MSVLIEKRMFPQTGFLKIKLEIEISHLTVFSFIFVSLNYVQMQQDSVLLYSYESICKGRPSVLDI